VTAQLRLTDEGGESDAEAGAGTGAVTIGEVLAALKDEFPELTISKIRYYERQGLLTPARSAAGYRKFTGQDVERLRYVLRAARDHYLPLRVIRERLAAAEEQNARARAALTGQAEPEAPDENPATDLSPTDVPAAEPDTVPEPGPTEAVVEPPAPVASQAVAGDLFSFTSSGERLTRRDLLRESGLTAEQLNELETYGLIAARGASTSYEAESLTIARIVAELSRYGLQARHLRPAKAAVDREVGLIEQVLTPLLRQASRDGRALAEQQAGEYAALSVRLHVALLEAALRGALH
jgi:DNA-binding transcriptional MerR regulator